MNDKDQAIIDHIASVSKHPHAAMIVKWLITGWPVEYYSTANNDWLPILAQSPIWDRNTKYRLIEPSPAKPAYRVYIDIDSGKPGMCSRGSDGVERSLPISDNFEWSGEWIEYDPPKKWPTPLIERIASIDIEAAKWLVDNHITDPYLISTFNWDRTPQRAKYWAAISKQLGE